MTIATAVLRPGGGTFPAGALAQVLDSNASLFRSVLNACRYFRVIVSAVFELIVQFVSIFGIPGALVVLLASSTRDRL